MEGLEYDPVLDVERIWSDHSVYIYRLCLRLTRDREIAEDLRQEVFLKVMDRRGAYKGAADVRSWVHSIAHNCCMDYHRRVRRQPAEPWELDVWGEPKLEGEWQVSEPVAFGWNAGLSLHSCSPLGRTLLELHYNDGLGHGDIAMLLGISRTAVGKKIHRALCRIKNAGG